MCNRHLNKPTNTNPYNNVSLLSLTFFLSRESQIGEIKFKTWDTSLTIDIDTLRYMVTPTAKSYRVCVVDNLLLVHRPQFG